MTKRLVRSNCYCCQARMSSKVLSRVNNYLSSKLDQLEGLHLTAHTMSNLTRSYYDHQIKGMEKIPSNKAAILVYYHGVIPVDYVALVSRLYIRDGRLVNSIVHRREIFPHSQSDRYENQSKLYNCHKLDIIGSLARAIG